MALFGNREGCWRYLDMTREPKLSHARPSPKRHHGGGFYHSSYDLDYELYKEDFPYRVYAYQKIPPLFGHMPINARRSYLGPPGGRNSVDPATDFQSDSNSTEDRTKSGARGAPWFNEDLRAMKRRGRQLERRWRKTKADSDKAAAKEHARAYAVAMMVAKKAYFAANGGAESSKPLRPMKVRPEELHAIKEELSQIKVQVDSLLESLDRMEQRREQPTGSKDGKKKGPDGGEASTLDESPSHEASEEPAAVLDVDSEESTDTEEMARNQTSDLENSQ